MAREDLRDDGGYDPNQIYSDGAKDHQGHSTNIRAHVPDTWVGAIAELVSSSDWPEYTTPQHVYRDAIYHRLVWAAKQPDRRTSPRVKALMALAQGQAALNYAAMQRAASQAYLDNARRVMSDLVGDGNVEAMKIAIKELEATLDFLDEPWRSEMNRELRTWEKRTYGF